LSIVATSTENIDENYSRILTVQRMNYIIMSISLGPSVVFLWLLQTNLLVLLTYWLTTFTCSSLQWLSCLPRRAVDTLKWSLYIIIYTVIRTKTPTVQLINVTCR